MLPSFLHQVIKREIFKWLSETDVKHFSNGTLRTITNCQEGVYIPA